MLMNQLPSNNEFLNGLALLQAGGLSSIPQNVSFGQMLNALKGILPPQNNQALPNDNFIQPLKSPEAQASLTASTPMPQVSQMPVTLGDVPRAASNQMGFEALKQAAAVAYPGNPIMQQVALSQAILESGAPGRMSQLATKNNNLFGIKAPGTQGTTQMNTTEYVNGLPTSMTQGFGKNDSVQDSFMQHRNLLTRMGRYEPVLESQSPQQAFLELQKAGYATDPNYAKKLNKIYNIYVQPQFGDY
jgi:flagellum-specific peptidoglycan hydrolase FlgJ